MSEHKNTATTPLRVLIADDVQETRHSLELLLDLIPNVELVAVAKNGREAVELAQQHRPNLAFMDVNMPELDGLSAIQAMMLVQPDLVCIVVSAEKQSETLQRAIHVGAKGYLIKPFNVQQVMEVTERSREWLQERQRQAEELVLQQRQQQSQLEQQAAEYARARRTDDQATVLFETLAAAPDCPERWLQVLAMMYIVRKDWMKLRGLATHLERTTSPH